MSSRGWCYLLENQGAITKGEFNRAQDLINDCRKSGLLPISICAEDSSRQHEHLEDLDDDDPEDYLLVIGETAVYCANNYTPLSFWEDKDVYLEMLVEKIDLKSLFSPICKKYRIPLANAKGWPDIHSRYAMLERFQEHDLEGRQCILLYCGDHDPAGLQISATLRAMFYDLEDAAGWMPDIEIVRFGLNADFIEQHSLSWIDGLETGSGKDLADPRHLDHRKPYVQDYLRRYGARKVEANALVVVPTAGRRLCEEAINRYLPPDAPEAYEESLAPRREDMRRRLADIADYLPPEKAA